VTSNQLWCYASNNINNAFNKELEQIKQELKNTMNYSVKDYNDEIIAEKNYSGAVVISPVKSLSAKIDLKQKQQPITFDSEHLIITETLDRQSQLEQENLIQQIINKSKKKKYDYSSLDINSEACINAAKHIKKALMQR